MLISLEGAICEFKALNGKYIEVKFQDEVAVSRSAIDNLIEMFNMGNYYALRIVTVNYNLLRTMAECYGFVNEVLWSNRLMPPAQVIFRQLHSFTEEQKIVLPNGDMVYSTVGYSMDQPITPVGPQDNVNIFVHEPNSQWKVLNTNWDCTNYTDRIDCEFSKEINSYLEKNGLVLVDANTVRKGTDYLEFMVNPCTDGITLQGEAAIELTSDRLCLYNQLLNIPLTEAIISVNDKFQIVKSLLDKCTMFIFTHENKHYLCYPQLKYLTQVSSLPADAYDIPTPIGLDCNGQPICSMRFMEQPNQGGE